MGLPAIAEALVARGADLRATDERGWTPLHHAAARTSNGVTESLLWLHGERRLTRSSARLHGADARNAMEMTTMLLAHGAVSWLKDDQGATPVEVALANGWRKIASVLECRSRADSRELRGRLVRLLGNVADGPRAPGRATAGSA